MARKALLGNKIRRLRQDRGLTQQQMAVQLGISPSYLNLIEHNERPVTVPLLLKLGQSFEVDLQDLSEEDERKLAVGLREVFADATLRNHEVKAEELRALVDAAPTAAKGIIELYRAYKTAREDAQALVLGLPGGSGEASPRRLLLPTEEARDFFYDRINHFPTIEEAAETLWREARLDPADPHRGLVDYLAQRHGIVVEIEGETPGALGSAVARQPQLPHRLSHRPDRGEAGDRRDPR
jgi:XRE family transcriptional regulator, fatty acid utilization regulator